MSEVDLKEVCLSVVVVSVDANKKERRRSDERKKDLRQLCLDADVLPLHIYGSLLCHTLRIVELFTMLCVCVSL